jgi:hypothetical protein
VGASSRKSVELIDGGPTTIERALSDTHRHGQVCYLHAGTTRTGKRR